MARNDYYTIKSVPGNDKAFTVIAVDEDYEKTKEYHIDGSACDCWAGQKWCRHKQILVKFKQGQKIDSNEYWNHDKSKWLPKPKGAE